MFQFCAMMSPGKKKEYKRKVSQQIGSFSIDVPLWVRSCKTEEGKKQTNKQKENCQALPKKLRFGRKNTCLWFWHSGWQISRKIQRKNRGKEEWCLHPWWTFIKVDHCCLLETSCKAFHTAAAADARILSRCRQTRGSVFLGAVRHIKCNRSVLWVDSFIFLRAGAQLRATRWNFSDTLTNGAHN